MTTDFDSILDRRATASLKWDRHPVPNVIPMWVADMELRRATTDPACPPGAA